MVRRTVTALALVGVLHAPIEVEAQTSLGVDFTSVSSNVNSSSSWVLGWSFNVLNPFSVTHLGVYDGLMNGLNQSHAVGLWDPFGTLIASATVPSGTGSTLMGFFRMVSIAPVALAVGNNYRIAAVFGTEKYTFNPGGFSTFADIKYTGSRYVAGNTLVDPTGGDSMKGYFGANFGAGTLEEQIATLEQEILQLEPGDIGASTAPEPVSMLLVGTGLAGIAGVRRRKRENQLESEAASA